MSPIRVFSSLQCYARRSIEIGIVLQQNPQVTVIKRVFYGPLLDRQSRQEINPFFSLLRHPDLRVVTTHSLVSIDWYDSQETHASGYNHGFLIFTGDMIIHLKHLSSLFPLGWGNFVPWDIGRSVVCNSFSLCECHGKSSWFKRAKTTLQNRVLGQEESWWLMSWSCSSRPDGLHYYCERHTFLFAVI